jgi:hypothetical protein
MLGIVADLRQPVLATGGGGRLNRFPSPSRDAADTLSRLNWRNVVDRFESKKMRFLDRPHLGQLCVTPIASTRELVLLDLRGAAAHESFLHQAATDQPGGE